MLQALDIQLAESGEKMERGVVSSRDDVLTPFL